ncbi:MAG: hypothetical protein IKU60_02475 [Clostridia bacterium]|nr:hypothetical protein [Clostridia bacterium]
MKKLAYFKTEEGMSPKEVSDILEMAKKSGYDDVIVYHHENADIRKSAYREVLLSVLRGAYRHKVGIYFADDRYDFSGTGFGELSSVKALWQKVVKVRDKGEESEGEEILFKEKGRYTVKVYPEAIGSLPYGHMPDLTNPKCASMIIEGIYKPLVNEFKKFVGYEFKGFLCNCPLYCREEYDLLPYSEEVKPDLSDAVKYKRAVQEAMERNYVMPLKRFCDENKLEFILATGKGSVSHKVGKSLSVFIDPSPLGEGSYEPCVENVYEAVWKAYAHKKAPLVKVGYGMEKICAAGTFFEKCPGFAIVDLKEFKTGDKDGYLIVNNSDEKISLGLLPRGDWVIYDWEKEEVYDFRRKTYTFYPYSFLCIKKKKNEYPESLPVRVGGVTVGEYEKEADVKFTRDGNKVTFTLPEESLTGKCIEFKGSVGYLKVKMGYSEHSFAYDGRVLPLYDFLCGSECTMEEYNGQIEEIIILKKSL